jgi:mannitol-1-phosphate 5-dehydrogenase
LQKAVQFGGGNIGRGFTGQLFSEAGFEVVFIDVVQSLVDEINQRRSYPIRIACEEPYIVTVENVRAVSGKDIPAVAQEIVTADVLCTAVGVNVLPFIAPAIAAGVKARADAGVNIPINIVICENMQRMSVFLKEKVKAELDESYYAYLDEMIGFVESVVGRMVPVMTEEQKKEDSLLVVVEPYKHLPIAKSMIKGTFPEVAGIELAANFQSFVDRKLYAHNAGHACAAYLGYLKGYEFLYEVMRDKEIYQQVQAAMLETGEALIKKHDLNAEEHRAHIADLLTRFGNIALGDQVSRVGRDPVRKLGPDDRLVGGAKLCLEYGVKPVHICRAIAAALKFNPEGDPSAPKVQELVANIGAAGALREIGGLAEDSEITQLVVKG